MHRVLHRAVLHRLFGNTGCWDMPLAAAGGFATAWISGSRMFAREKAISPIDVIAPMALSIDVAAVSW